MKRDRNILKHLDTLYVLNFVSLFLRILIEPILDPCGLSRPWSCPRRCRFQKPHFSVKTVVAEKSKNPAHVSLARAHFLVKFVWHKEDLFKTFNVMISSPKWSTWTYHALVANRKAATAWIWGPWPVAMHRTLISRLFCAHKIHKNDSRICDELFQPKAAQILEISFFIFLKPPTEQWCTNRPRNNRHTYWGSGQEEIRAPFLLLLSLYCQLFRKYIWRGHGFEASTKQNGNGIRARSPTQLPYKPNDCKILLFICWASECISISPATSQATRISSFFPFSSVLAHWSKIFASFFRPANTKQGWWWPG